MPVIHHLPRPRDLVRFAPHDESHWVALRAGLSVGVPLAVLAATGHAGWSLYASFGAFTAIFGRADAYRRRVHTQFAAASVQVLAVMVGTAVAASGAGAWALVAASAAIAVVASLVGEAVGWRPAGPLFAVFAVATTAGVPATAAALVPALLVSASAAALSMLIGLAGAVSLRRRTMPRSPSAAAGSLVELLRSTTAWTRAARYAAAVLIAGSIATLVGIGHPSWAMIAAVVPLASADAPHAFLRATHRVLGTGLGLVLAAGLFTMGSRGWALIVLVIVLQALTEMFIARNYGFAMVFVTPLALTMSAIVVRVPAGQLLRDRATETIVGAIVGLAITVAAGEHRGAAAPPTMSTGWGSRSRVAKSGSAATRRGR